MGRPLVERTIGNRTDLLTNRQSLFINVWAPANATTGSNLPVKVWLFGGGNQAGGISNPTYDGCAASESVIQVSINYRVGPMGFLSLQSLNLPGNQGIQDQLLGLQWVKENIAAFGGNSSKVLLFGQSAGALDAFIISSLPQAPSLISAAILESGAGSNLSTIADVEAQNEAFVKGLNCSTTDIACLRDAPISAINASSTAISGSLGVVVDGTIIPSQPLQQGLKVPAMAGSTTDEGTLFLLAQYQTGILDLNATSYNQYLTSSFGPLAQQINQTYPLTNYESATQPVLAAMSAVMTHSRFRCPTRRFLRQAVQDGMPVWTYSFNHTLTCPWYPTIPSIALPLLLSTHTAEIPFVFGGTDRMPRPNGNCSLTAGEKALSTKMMAAWDSMAAIAKPGGDWPQYNSENSMGVNVVGDDFSAGTVDYSMCDFWDRIQLNMTSSGGNGSGSGRPTNQGPSLDARSLLSKAVMTGAVLAEILLFL